MTPQELATLEKCLCSMEEPEINIQSLNEQHTVSSELYGPVAYTSEFIQKFYANYPSCRLLTPELTVLCNSTKKLEKTDRKRGRHSTKASRMRARQERQSERFLSRLTGNEERPRARRRSRRGNSTSSSPYYYHHPGGSVNPDYQDYWYPPARSGRRSSHRRALGLSSSQDYFPADFEPVYVPPHPLPPPPPLPSQQSHYRYRPSSRPSHHYSRNNQHSNRHSDRINTITCACGSSNYHYHDRYYAVDDRQSNANDNTTTNSTTNISGDNFRSTNYSSIDEDFRERCPYNQALNPEQQYPSHMHQWSQEDDLNIVVAPPQPSIHDIVLNAMASNVDLMPSGLLPDEDDLLVPQTRAPSPPSSRLEKLEALERSLSNNEEPNRYEENSDPDNPSSRRVASHSDCCNDCDNNASCDKNKITTEEISEQDSELESPSKSMETDSKCDNCSCHSEDEELCSELPVDLSAQHEGSTSNLPNVNYEEDQECLLPSIPSEDDDNSLPPPVPGVRSIHTSFRPYAECQLRENENDDAGENESVEEKCDNKETNNKIKEENLQVDSETKVKENVSSGSTSPHHSGAEDDEEVALALQDAEVAISWKARERSVNFSHFLKRLLLGTKVHFSNSLPLCRHS